MAKQVRRPRDDAGRHAAADVHGRIRDLVRAGRHADAVDTASAALEAASDPLQRLDLLDARVASALALLELARAETDALQMVTLAERNRSAEAQARALCALSA